MSDLDWNGDAAMEHVRSRAVRFLTRAAIMVQRRAKELLSIAGTAVHIGLNPRASAKAHHARMVAENRAFVRHHNKAYALAIKMGAFKKLRVTKAGHITDIAKPGSKKKYYFNVGGKMVRRRRKPKGNG